MRIIVEAKNLLQHGPPFRNVRKAKTKRHKALRSTGFNAPFFQIKMAQTLM
jgi:hypothetical protein